MRRVLLALLIVTVILGTIGFGAALADKGGNGNTNKNHHNCQAAGAANVIGVCIEKNHVHVPIDLDILNCVGVQLGLIAKCEA